MIMMALIIALVMVVGTLSVMGTVYAAVPDDKISISGLEEGDKVTFYQILEWNGTEAAQYAGWDLVTPFKGKGTTLGFTDDKALIKEMVGDPKGNPQVPMKLTSEIAGKLARLATSGGKTPVTVGADGKAELTIDGTTNTIGMYMAIIDPADDDNVYNPVFVSADYTEGGSNSWVVDSTTASYSNSSAAKKGTVEVNKEDLSSTQSFDQTWRSTRIGEVVNYKITTTIPGYGNIYQDPHYVITDQLTSLELVDEPAITLTKPADLNGTTGTADPDNTTYDYYITKATDNKSYTITFTKKYLKKITVPTEVEVTYSAKVTTDAELNVNLEKNEVWVEYSHNPQDESDYNVKKDETRHYTYTIDADALGVGSDQISGSTSEIVKVGVDASGNPVTSKTMKSWITPEEEWKSPLADAEFKLYTDEDCQNEYVKADGSKFTTIKSDANGRIKIEGLDATNEDGSAVYWLKETKAPTGFIAQTSAVKIEIIPEFETKTYTQYWDATKQEWVDSDPTGSSKSDEFEVQILKSYTVKVDGNESKHTFTNQGAKTITTVPGSTKELPSSIVNTQGVELPSTGGIGTTIFYIIGAILVLGAGILLVTRRRMDAE